MAFSSQKRIQIAPEPLPVEPGHPHIVEDHQQADEEDLFNKKLKKVVPVVMLLMVIQCQQNLTIILTQKLTFSIASRPQPRPKGQKRLQESPIIK